MFSQFQKYVDDIKSLTKTRDSVALDLEQENQTLRVTLDEIHLQQGAASLPSIICSSELFINKCVYTETQRSEITEMLLQEGLDDIISISLSEQVAYVLADRASLLEKIQIQTDVDSKSCGHPKGCEEMMAQGFGENVVKVISHDIDLISKCCTDFISRLSKRWHHYSFKAPGRSSWDSEKHLRVNTNRCPYVCRYIQFVTHCM